MFWTIRGVGDAITSDWHTSDKKICDILTDWLYIIGRSTCIGPQEMNFTVFLLVLSVYVQYIYRYYMNSKVQMMGTVDKHNNRSINPTLPYALGVCYSST
ncbi:hypothetical protein ACJX0J_013637 [Zea mays]